MAQQSLGREVKVVHCAGCGLILGKDCPSDVVSCPRCRRILRLGLVRLDDDDLEVTEFVSVESLKKRFVALYVSEAKVRFVLAGTTKRAPAWEQLVLDLEEERLKAFCRQFGWVMAAVHRDPGPGADDALRPFSALAVDLAEGIANAILVTDPERVTRKDLHRLCNLSRRHGAVLTSITPHRCDPNLELDDVDYSSIDDSSGDQPALEQLWSRETSDAVQRVMDAVGWNWPQYVADVAARTMVPRAFQIWRETDAGCLERGWRTILREFAIARTRRAGHLQRVTPPALFNCRLCKRRFLDAALPVRLVEKVTTAQAFCRTCLERAFFSDHDGAGRLGPHPLDQRCDIDSLTSALRSSGERRLEAFLERVLAGRNDDDQAGGRTSPSDRFLTAARATQLIDLGEIAVTDKYNMATDGHILRSLGAALLDNWLTRNGLPHRRDVRYPVDAELNPSGTLRADFAVGEVLLEFLGLRGIDEFSKQIERRLDLARRGKVELIGIYAEDLLAPDVLHRKAASLIATYRIHDEEIPR